MRHSLVKLHFYLDVFSHCIAFFFTFLLEYGFIRLFSQDIFIHKHWISRCFYHGAPDGRYRWVPASSWPWIQCPLHHKVGSQLSVTRSYPDHSTGTFLRRRAGGMWRSHDSKFHVRLGTFAKQEVSNCFPLCTRKRWEGVRQSIIFQQVNFLSFSFKIKKERPSN